VTGQDSCWTQGGSINFKVVGPEGPFAEGPITIGSVLNTNVGTLFNTKLMSAILAISDASCFQNVDPKFARLCLVEQ